MRAAVVGHVEWVKFLRVNRPPIPGSVMTATEAWEEAAGGGAVAAVELARLAAKCTLFTAVGADRFGQGIAPALAAYGVGVLGPTRPAAHRHAITLLDPAGERTIVVIGPAQAPCGGEVELGALDAIYFCKGDAALVRAAREAARVLVATARILPVLQEAGVRLDALVLSDHDASERYTPGDLDPAPTLVARTQGADGGSWSTADGREGRWPAATLPGPIADSYGCGDSFAAGLAFALAQGRAIPEALAFAAIRGAAALCRRGVSGSQQANN
ncbi:MAG: hypothetical protein AUK47_07270 [Deltaproteobacteria bacterium CG2_30_63_29]|nr:MAG: hypothetical protein AUK47_07270 [Deltaproteobacteria bacterium CG2_30_63_29]PIW02030.1 MAG: ribokinase [Deltaproteobacteria bacterium CG17_big_fil_post_rev_8_21_14_2_50_63_7]